MELRRHPAADRGVCHDSTGGDVVRLRDCGSGVAVSVLLADPDVRTPRRPRSAAMATHPVIRSVDRDDLPCDVCQRPNLPNRSFDVRQATDVARTLALAPLRLKPRFGCFTTRANAAIYPTFGRRFGACVRDCGRDSSIRPT